MTFMSVNKYMPVNPCADSISCRGLRQFNNVIKCIIPGTVYMEGYDDYGCYCDFGGSDTLVDELDMCCQTRDNCYGQVEKMENCKPLIDNPYTSCYSYSCSGNEVTCRDKNNPCEAFIFNCDREAAICFSKAPYNKEVLDLSYHLNKNNPCEVFICNCDHQAAICFSQAPYNKYYKGDNC
ncbi:phospholipase A2, minor isoenzyme-like [Onychomys torridus]|uniref:phospholipase A2, minor isoenzyme-like n=1 Tax=Onychomys torridus TaxID=38674 RepID=UPI00167F4CFE|nr:phospholipase A2, minor isoenzyme-like [Onychomys torridus]